MSYLSFLKHAQAYVAGTKEEHLRASSEADESTPKIHRIMEAKARAAGQPWPAAMRQQRTAAIEHFEDFIGARPDSPESVFAWQEAWRPGRTPAQPSPFRLRLRVSDNVLACAARLRLMFADPQTSIHKTATCG